MTTDPSTGPLSLVLTLESEHYADPDELTEAVRAVAEQMAAWPAGGERLAEFLVVHDEGLDRGRLRQSVEPAWAPARDAGLPGPRWEATRGLGYYQQKNRAAELAEGETLLVFDGDVLLEEGAVRALVEAHDTAPGGVVTGLCHIVSQTAAGRAFALFSAFDDPVEDPELAPAAGVHGNNFVVARRTLLERPFPDSPTFRRDCYLWAQSLLAEGRPVLREERAGVAHPAPEGRAAMTWRALRQGHDDVWMFTHRGRFIGVLAAAVGVANAARRTARGIAKILSRPPASELEARQVPAALAVALGYGATVAAGAVRAWIAPRRLRRRLTGREEEPEEREERR